MIRECSRILLVGCVLGAVVFFVATPFYIDDGDQWSLFREAPLAIVMWSLPVGRLLELLRSPCKVSTTFRSATLDRVAPRRRAAELRVPCSSRSSPGNWRMIDLKSLVLSQDRAASGDVRLRSMDCPTSPRRSSPPERRLPRRRRPGPTRRRPRRGGTSRKACRFLPACW